MRVAAVIAAVGPERGMDVVGDVDGGGEPCGVFFELGDGAAQDCEAALVVVAALGWAMASSWTVAVSSWSR